MFFFQLLLCAKQNVILNLKDFAIWEQQFNHT